MISFLGYDIWNYQANCQNTWQYIKWWKLCILPLPSIFHWKVALVKRRWILYDFHLYRSSNINWDKKWCIQRMIDANLFEILTIWEDSCILHVFPFVWIPYMLDLTKYKVRTAASCVWRQATCSNPLVCLFTCCRHYINHLPVIRQNNNHQNGLLVMPFYIIC